MPRTINPEEFHRKRNQILDIAQSLVQTKGYEEMAIQDILDTLQISKGAFYHYFSSKPALLEGLVERLAGAVVEILDDSLKVPELAAPAKLNRFFAAVGIWKSQRRELVLSFARVWMLDENAIVRQKLNKAVVKQLSPRLDEIVAQGMAEGYFSPAFPKRAGELFAILIQNMNHAVAEQLLADEAEGNDERDMLETYAAYADLMERLLGAASGTLTIVEPDILATWHAPLSAGSEGDASG